jgi:Na+-translocating ferredoxin:NAD+ oxidoreductase RNF subunit RnfB
VVVLSVLYAFLSVVVLGGLLGIGLAIASKFLAVSKDKRLEEAEAALPGLNCGACGFAGCSAYAEAVVENDAELTLCTPGGSDAARGLAEIMGEEISLTESVKRVAQVHCRGGRETSEYRFDYSGISDCNALFQLFGGDKVCPHGCLALGSCMNVCPVECIHYDDEGLVVIDPERCIACGQCMDVCPTGVIHYVPYPADYIVACNSTDKGAQVRKYCSVGCIGCKLCEKQSPEGGFAVEDFLASIDYEKTGDRSKAAEKCPPKCIIPLPLGKMIRTPEKHDDVVSEEEAQVANVEDE